MFQREEIEKYQKITAPTELKDRVRFSVIQTKKAMRKKMAVTVAAGLTLFLVSGSLLGKNSVTLSVNDVVVTRETLCIENQEVVPLTVNVSQQRSLPVYIPMEIAVLNDAKISVNVGTLLQMNAEKQSAGSSSIEFSKSVQVYWILDEYTQEDPVCTITSGWKEVQYAVEYEAETGAYRIKKTK